MKHVQPPVHALLGFILLVFAHAPISAGPEENRSTASKKPPNILMAFGDDWGLHASAYGTEEVETPTFDHIADVGAGFQYAFVSTPSCTPSRGALLTGKHPWRLGPGANLHGTLPKEYSVYPRLLEKKANYFVGHTRKGWGPGNWSAGGRSERPAGPKFDSFDAFMDERPDDQPFCFWFGSKDPHRPYSDSLRKKMDIDPEKVNVPPTLPDVPAARKDIANYLAEVQRFDREIGEILDHLEEIGELENTLVVIAGDHGWPFPHGKSELYDAGTRVPLAIAGPGVKKHEKMVKDFVSITDLAPTFLEAAGLSIPDRMTGRSLMNLLKHDRDGQQEDHRSHMILAKERHHGLARPGGTGYPMRAIRTEHFLYIRNYKPDRWPMGSPYISSSQKILSDRGWGPTKKWMIEHANDPDQRHRFRMSFAKRPAEELYNVKEDPHQLNNLAGKPAYQPLKKHLSRTLSRELHALEDPRETDAKVKFDDYPYHVDYGSKKVEPPESVKKALNLGN